MALDSEFFVGTAGGTSAPKVLATANSTTAGGVYMAKLGDFQFGIDTAAFEKLERRTTYSWPKQDRIGRTGARQFTGQDDDEITITGTIYPHFRGGVGQMGTMRSMAGRGTAMRLVYAFERVGQYAGQWCITEIGEGRPSFFRDGMPRKIEFDIKLKAYGDDDAPGAAALLDGKAALARTTIDGSLGPAGTINMSNSATYAVEDAAAQVAAAPVVTSTSPVGDFRSIASSVRSVVSSVAAVAQDVRETIGNAVTAASDAVFSLVPPEVVQLARDGMSITNDVLAFQDQAVSGLYVIQDLPVQIKAATTSAGATLEGYRRLSQINAGNLRIIGDQLASVGSAGQQLGDPVERLAASALVGNLARAADMLTSTAATARDQAATIVGKINV